MTSQLDANASSASSKLVTAADAAEEEELWSDFRQDLISVRHRAAKLRERVGRRLGSVEIQDAVARELAALEAAGRTTREILLAKLEEEWTAEWTAKWDRQLREESQRETARATRLREQEELRKQNEKQRLQAGDIATAFAAIGDGDGSSGTTLPHQWVVDKDVSRRLLNVLVETRHKHLTAAAGPSEQSPTTGGFAPTDDLVDASDATAADVGLDIVALRVLLSRELGIEFGHGNQTKDDAVTDNIRSAELLTRSSPGHRASVFDYADAILAPTLEATLREALREARAADREGAPAGA
jgi:hypothetical protein